MIAAASFIEPLRALGYSQYTGVPCSFLKPFINYVIESPALDYVGAASEGEAVGIAMGAYLAGRKTVVMCQNSGLGNMVNPLTSLNYPFRIPTLLISTWRGQPGAHDEPQHEQMGRIMHRLFDTLEIPWLPFPAEESDIVSVLDQAEASMTKRLLPFALVMAKDTVTDFPLTRRFDPASVHTRLSEQFRSPPGDRMIRTEALQIILETLPGGEAIIATTGKTGRELFTLADRPNHLYVVGGMGTAAAIGLGLAHAAPDQPVVVIDGDGALLMKLGCLATIGFYQPKNLIHIVLDNEVHDSTGGQQTASAISRFAGMAAAANYRQAAAADHPDDLRHHLARARQEDGPSLLHVKIRKGSPESLGRPTVKPHEVKDRFMSFIRSQRRRNNP